VSESPAAQLARIAAQLQSSGLNAGTSGNVSIRVTDGLLVTPSAVPPELMTAEVMVELTDDGKLRSAGVPTSEWRIHAAIYGTFPAAGAVVHTHSTYATALASLREDLPAFHYQVAKAGGHLIACAQYAPFGSPELSDAVITALGNRRVCLMANHGMIAYAPTLDAAFALALEVETLCQQYLIARSVGQPYILSAEQMDDVLERFAQYGKPVS
jgi:L-fuculose-phosphate aldolase